VKAISDILPAADIDKILKLETRPVPKSKTAMKALLADKEHEMKEAAKRLDFELAAILRDEIRELTKKVGK
jgi:excinuclease UvrABC helicase subunit UvrB